MRLFHHLLPALALYGSAAPVWGLCVENNKTLPAVTLGSADGDKAGQIIYRANTQELHYQPWSSASLNGKTFVVYHLAARQGIDSINDAFIKALHSLPENSYQLVVMLNIDDVFTGGKYFARKTFENNAKESGGHVMFVLDHASVLREHWCIDTKSSTIMLVNARNEVFRAKDGALSEADITDYLLAIQQVSTP